MPFARFYADGGSGSSTNSSVSITSVMDSSGANEPGWWSAKLEAGGGWTNPTAPGRSAPLRSGTRIHYESFLSHQKAAINKHPTAKKIKAKDEAQELQPRNENPGSQ